MNTVSNDMIMTVGIITLPNEIITIMVIPVVTIQKLPSVETILVVSTALMVMILVESRSEWDNAKITTVNC